jgi:hypothetical protein
VFWLATSISLCIAALKSNSISSRGSVALDQVGAGVLAFDARIAEVGALASAKIFYGLIDDVLPVVIGVSQALADGGLGVSMRLFSGSVSDW